MDAVGSTSEAGPAVTAQPAQHPRTQVSQPHSADGLSRSAGRQQDSQHSRLSQASQPTRTRSSVVYFGTPGTAVPPLQALCAAGHQVVLVVTRPPKRRGRRQAPTPSPVQDAAVELGLTVSHDISDASAASADVAVVVAYGELIPSSVLQKRRTVNLHFSLLPRWRGAAPVERAILAGDAETGVCLMEVAPDLDAGAVYRRRSTAIAPDESADDLRARLCDLGVEMLLEALNEGFGEPAPQSGEVAWADKISTDELRIDWAAPAEHVLRLVRVGGAWTTFRGKRLKVLAAQQIVGSPAGSAAVPALAPDISIPFSSEASRVVGLAEGSAAVPVSGTAAGLTGGPSSALSQAAAAGQAPAAGQAAAAGRITLRTPSAGPAEVLVGTGRGALRLLRVQSEGRSATSAPDWANGARIAAGECFDARVG